MSHEPRATASQQDAASAAKRARLDRAAASIRARAKESDFIAGFILVLMIVTASAGAYLALGTWFKETRTVANLASALSNIVALRQEIKTLSEGLSDIENRLENFRHYQSLAKNAAGNKAAHLADAEEALQAAEAVAHRFWARTEPPGPGLIDTDWGAVWIRVGVGVFTVAVLQVLLGMYRYNRQAAVTLASRAELLDISGEEDGAVARIAVLLSRGVGSWAQDDPTTKKQLTAITKLLGERMPGGAKS